MDFAIFGIAWWLFALGTIVFGVLVSMTTFEKPLSALAFLAVAGVALSYLAGVDLLQWATSNITDLFVWSVAYALFGIAFAYIKWTWFYLPSDTVQSKIQAAFSNFKSTHSIVGMSGKERSDDELIDEFTQSVYYPFGLRQDKWKIATWAIWWPLVLFWTTIDDIVLKIINWFATVLAGSFGSIAKNQVRKTITQK